MDNLKFNELLKKLNACDDAVKSCENKSLQEAWEQSERGDWMLWLCKKINLDLRKLTLAKARCAKLVIHLMKDQRSIDAVNAAEKYGLGLIDTSELNAASAASAAYAAYAAYAAAAYAAAAYAADAARKGTLNRCAIEIRKVVSVDDIIKSIS